MASPPTTQLPSAQKRKAPSEPIDESQFALDDDDGGLIPITQNCDQIRRKIHAYIDGGAMNVKEFCAAIGVSNKSYNDFLRQTDPQKGMNSSTYAGALQFFQKREAAGVAMLKKAKIADGQSTRGAGAGGAGGARKAAEKGEKKTDISGITLEGEDEDAVEIYDTCDEIRRKINAYLKKPGVTQAAFLRDLSAQYHTEPGKKIQSTQLNAFRGKKGATAGNQSSVYYAAYVFFEKLRIAEGKKKSKHREDMEEIYGGQGGVDTERRTGRVWVCMGGDQPVEDKYGQINILRNGMLLH